MSNDHTPTPWRSRRSAGRIVITRGMPGLDLVVVAEMSTNGPTPAVLDADFIVRAVNAHDELVKALLLAEDWFISVGADGSPLPSVRAALAKVRAP